jgi:hypothetical protein
MKHEIGVRQCLEQLFAAGALDDGGDLVILELRQAHAQVLGDETVRAGDDDAHAG